MLRNRSAISLVGMALCVLILQGGPSVAAAFKAAGLNKTDCTELAKKQKSLEDARNVLKEKQDVVAKTQEGISEATRSMENLEPKSTNTASELQDSQKKLDEAKKTLSTAQAEATVAETTLTKANDDATAFQQLMGTSSLDSQRLLLQVKKKTAQDAAAALKTKQDAVTKAQELVNEANRKVETPKAGHETASKTLQETKQKLEVMKKQLSSEETETAAAEASVKQAGDELAAIKKPLGDSPRLEAQCNELMTKT